VAFPRSVEELAELLGRASEEGWSVIPAGGGSWIDGGGAPERVDVVVSTREMDTVVEYEPDDLTLTAQAGLTLGELARATREHGQWLAQDPARWPTATLGAFVATGLPGPLVAGFGRPRDHLLGLTAVSGDGRILRPGGKVVKNVAGFDLVRLLAGSWGTLAVVAGATVRLFPLPRREVTLRFEAPDPRELVEPARALATASVVPEALELVWGSGARGEGRARSALLVRVMGSPEAVEEKVGILEGATGLEPARLEDGASRAAHRDLAEGAHRTGSGSADRAPLSLRLSSLPAQLGQLVEMARTIEEVGDAGVRVAASVTRGTLQVNVEPPQGSEEGSTDAFPADRWTPLIRGLRESLVPAGGQLTLLRAPRALTSGVGSRCVPGDGAALLEGIRRSLDPSGILAPGRLAAGETRGEGG